MTYRSARILFLLLLVGCVTPAMARYEAAVRADLCEARIVIYGDSRPTGFPAIWEREDRGARQEVIRKIAGEAPDLVLHSGDLVFNGADGGSWRQFDDEHRLWRERGIPFYPILGNHEYFADNEAPAGHFFPRFPLLGDRMWYDVRQGPVLFLMLNSNFYRLTEEEIAAQDRWLDGQLESARADETVRAVVVVCHHPPYTNAIFTTGNRNVENHFVARIHGHPKVKALFAGHVHSYERFLMDGILYVVSGGGGAPLVPLQQNPAKTTFRDLCSEQNRRYHFCLGRITRDTLAFEVFNLKRDMTWSVMDRFEISLK